MDHEAEVEGIGVGLGPEGSRIPAIVLDVREEYLPIFVTHDQADSIRLALSGEPFERPLTHDLMVEMVTEFGGAVDGIRIDDLSDGTFYAKVDAQRYENGEPEPFVFDARPSDAIALAVRVDCTITVSDEIIDEAGRPPEELAPAGDEEGMPGGDPFGEAGDPFDDHEEFGEFGEEEFGGDTFDDGPFGNDPSEELGDLDPDDPDDESDEQ
ncbi:Bifunctional nuclease, with DNase and RNase activity [Halalkaliarchaeum sp. AArc-CO]|nr:Bifunctional nuclease, with DNase and RNase activity [Halalkaliarchaeum sp. AArc-CO]